MMILRRNYSQVMVLLLRLRQVCNHPCLILEDGSAFIRPDEWDHENMPADIRRELARARDLVSPQFVVQVKERLKDQALKRLQAENHVRGMLQRKGSYLIFRED
jgi:SNF2 family DNA or RNA helicase